MGSASKGGSALGRVCTGGVGVWADSSGTRKAGGMQRTEMLSCLNYRINQFLHSPYPRSSFVFWTHQFSCMLLLIRIHVKDFHSSNFLMIAI